MTKTEVKTEKTEIIREMYMEGACIYDIACAVDYQPNTVEQTLWGMGFSVSETRPIKVKQRKPNIFPVTVDGKEYWDITDVFLSSEWEGSEE